MRFRLTTPFRPAAMAMACGGWMVAMQPCRAANVWLPTAPSGFANAPVAPVFSGLGDDILDGLAFSATLSGTYNNNITQSPGGSVAPVKDDFILSLGGNVSYQTLASVWTFGGNYRGSYDCYFDNSEYSAYNQSAGLLANYDGGRLTASVNLGVSYDQGSNRYYSTADIVERTSISTGVQARYRLSPKTSLQGNLGQSFSTSSGDYQDTESFNAGLSALWRYSALTEFGPGIRYTYSSGGSQAERTSIGPTLSLNYKLSKKVALNSRLGVDFASYEDGGSSDPMFSASVGLNYQASKLWGMDLSFYRDAEADPSQAGRFNQITSLRVGYHRKIRRATWNVGASYETNTYQTGGDVENRPDRDYIAIDSSLGMPVFSNTTMASVFVRYNDQNGGSRDSFDSCQVGFSLSRSF